MPNPLVTKRPLGATGILVSEIGFGSWAIGGNMWGPQDDAVSLASLRRAFDRGIDFVDTAAIYGMGRSERIVGQAIRQSRARVVVATKIPPKNMAWPAKAGTPLRDAFPAKHIVRETEESLRRLGVERIDLQQLHVWTEDWTNDNEWWDALMELRERHLVREIGVSINGFEPKSALELVRKQRVSAIQVVHNIFEQAPEDELFPEAAKNGVGIISRVPFDESSLTGKLTKESTWPEDDFRSRYFAGERLGKVVERVSRVRKDFVPSAAPSLPRLALRYVLSQSAVSSVIPGMRSLSQVEENALASSDGTLASEILEQARRHRWDRTPTEWP